MVAHLTTIKPTTNHAEQSMELSNDSDTYSLQYLDDDYTPINNLQHTNSDPQPTNGKPSQSITLHTNTNSTSPSFLDYLPHQGAPSPDTREPTNKLKTPMKVEVQVERCPFISVLSLTPHTAHINKMEVEIELVSSSNSYYPSDAQL
jgi:hypothetical protein